ncbi:topoisomerase DNA-binding C4 zinc finger domain-containing protein [Galbibacter marinus]
MCPDCKSGYMTKRKGRFRIFLGCTNYPRCKNTINLDN